MGFFSRQRNDGEGEFAGSKHTDSFLPRFRNGDRGIGWSDHRLTALAFSSTATSASEVESCLFQLGGQVGVDVDVSIRDGGVRTLCHPNSPSTHGAPYPHPTPLHQLARRTTRPCPRRPDKPPASPRRSQTWRRHPHRITTGDCLTTRDSLLQHRTPGPPVVSIEAFLSLTQQVQTLAGMMQAIVLYIPQLAQVLAHQHLNAPR
ncbi:hypothetical protein B296_00005182 [Ensete ventricosum]|uniref:Uncharacterized protein n=1 Tax=Ensete ventricosum TaxID=4639 RepID=A0A427ATL0_ENSVE|nr:hypothetical protein B296_00005182 [Ensete ventricosum]